MMTKRFITTFMKLPKDFAPKAPTPGTRAHEYLSGARHASDLTDDPELLFIIDDKHPEGGLLYVFNDRSSVVFKPPVQ